MDRPTEVYIAGLRWEIRWDLEPKGDLGLCYKQDQMIHIDGEQSDASVRDTLLHEIIHACWRDPLKKRPTEEQVVLTLTPALLSMLQDDKNNPVMDFLKNDSRQGK